MFLLIYIYGISHVYFKTYTSFSYSKPNFVSHLYLKFQTVRVVQLDFPARFKQQLVKEKHN